jgi:predicted nucleic acid-binding protein
MILYMDTSALLKKYFKEPGSDEVIWGWKNADAIVISSVAYAETVASIYRKKREVGGKGEMLVGALSSFKKDWKSLIRVEVNDDLNQTIDRIVASHPLRGFDAIHLASALMTHENLPEDFYFVCFDLRLLAAAQMEGLQTLPEEST